MKHLEELSLGKRIVVTLIIVVVIILILLVVDMFARPVESQPVAISKYDGRIIALEKEALDEAYRNRVRHLFEVWTRDDQGQPARALLGIQHARRAYILAMIALERRERELHDSGRGKE
jgi:hypothetical protein